MRSRPVKRKDALGRYRMVMDRLHHGLHHRKSWDVVQMSATITGAMAKRFPFGGASGKVAAAMAHRKGVQSPGPPDAGVVQQRPGGDAGDRRDRPTASFT